MIRNLAFVLFLNLLAIQCHAMGTKSTEVQSGTTTTTQISGSKLELAQKVAAAYVKTRMPNNMFSIILKPVQKELDTSWGIKDAFGASVKNVDETYSKSFAPITSLLQETLTKAYAEKFSESELKDLLKTYESAVFQKESEMLVSWYIEEAFRTFKDPKIWQEYTQKFAGLFTAFLMTSMQVGQIMTNLQQNAATDTSKAMAELKIDLTTPAGQQAFKDKLIATYPSLTSFVPMIEGIVAKALGQVNATPNNSIGGIANSIQGMNPVPAPVTQ